MVHADGEGVVPPEALERAKLVLGHSCVGLPALGAHRQTHE